MNIIKTLTKRNNPRRYTPPTGVLIHTTGDTNLDAILKFYLSDDGDQPHYVIDKTGLIHQIVEEDHVAYHCALGAKAIELYQKGWSVWSRYVKVGKDQFEDRKVPYSGYNSWYKTWPTKRSPLELFTGTHPNSTTIGIELQQPLDKELTPDIFLDAQYDALVELLQDINKRLGIPLERTRVMGHYDASPMTRCNSKGGWDPGEKFNWIRAFTPPGVNYCSPETGDGNGPITT